MWGFTRPIMRSLDELHAKMDRFDDRFTEALKQSEARQMEALSELKSGLKQADKRIDDIACEMYTMNGQMLRIVGYPGQEGIIVERQNQHRNRPPFIQNPVPPLPAPDPV